MSSTDSTSSAPWEPPLPEELQAMLPQYEILGILGRGGMGAVYKGRQAKLDRIVAIKVLPETFTKGEDKLNFAKRFEQEARAMATLDHPAILSVYDFGETPEGQLYFVMEFVDGMDIHQYLKSHGGKLPAEHALAICAHVLDALEYAHKHGIVHRDIKPANILLNREGRVKIADFGLAKKFGDHADADAPALTMSNVAVGTPDFVAPEALDSDQVPDHRADLYAVGVMLYQMLTGKLPRGNYQMPSELNPGLDPRFDEIVSKAMAANPDCRYPSAASVRADLDLVLSGPITRVEAGVPSGEVRAVVPATTSLRGKKKAPPKPASKTPLFLGLGAAALVIAGLVVILAGKRGEPETLPAPPPEITLEKSPELPVQAATPAVPVPVTPQVKTPGPVVKTETPKAEAPAPPVAMEEKKTEPAAPTTLQPEAKTESKPAAAPESAPHPLASVPGIKTRLEAYLTARRTQLTDLATKYGRGLDSRLNQAADAGDLNMTTAYEEEKQRVNALVTDLTSPVPDPVAAAALVPALPDLPAGSPEPLQSLRQTWTTESGKIKATLDGALQQSLKVLESELTKSRDLDRAKLILAYRETLASPSPGKWKRLGITGAIPKINLSLVNKDKPFENTLGMKFVPVPGTSIFLCIHETRRSDYAAYADAVPGVDETWKAPVVEGAAIDQKDDHPVIQVSWEDSNEFCEWLSKEECLTYRLPSEHEWNLAVAIGLEHPDKMSPAEVVAHISDVYPWGNNIWEDGYRHGNYEGTSKDAFGGTAPVMSFLPNPLGIFDLGGNAWEWCDGWHDSSRTSHTMRGCGYRNFDAPTKSGARQNGKPDFRVAPLNDGMRRVPGFRCAIEVGAAVPLPAQSAQPVTTTSAAPAPQPAAVRVSTDSLKKATKDQPFTNSLGMKFVPVTGTNVLFCIHETRRRDYAVYAGEAENVNKQWQDTSFDSFQITDRLDDHPVANVDWDDARAFCAWISKREGFEIRLPTDEEWSFAVGIGRDENRKTGTPLSDLNMALKDQYPWGDTWPPRAGAGNFSDKSRKEKTIREGIDWIEEYDDGFPATAPVMSFKPNRSGLYDLGGNILEWCEDWYVENLKTERVLRGGSWFHGDKGWCLSSIRYKLGPNLGGPYTGFRCVIEVP